MKKWVYRIALMICIGVFAYSAYNLYLIYSTKAQIDKEVDDFKKDSVLEDKVNGFVVDWEAMKEKNEDIVAWIYVPDCKISFPVVQAEDNGFYLDHTVTKEWNELGSIFLDYENSSDFSDYNSIIYGHSVDGMGGMFTDLKNFENKDFFKKHPSIYLFTPKGNYEGHVLCFAKTDDQSLYYDMTTEDKDAHMAQMKKEALYSNDVKVKGNLLTLSTCNLEYGLWSTQRYILVAVLEPTDAPIEVK